MSEQYRKVLVCSVLFFTAILLCAASGQAGTVLVEAEGFDDKGGWVVDQQFMQVMGSPYLLAHGMGEPVADAVTTVTFPSTGTYKMWVRTKDWVPGAWTSPGRFQVLIDGTAVPTTFGTLTGWTWQDGGTINVTNTQVQIKLHDLTGFDGRCDAIYFDTNTSAVPVDFDVNSPDVNRLWRNGLLGLPATPPDGGQFDVVIVGGGIAGCGAALAAEQEGLTVALIQDRPLLGGNASSEIRVHTLGIHGDGSAILSQIDTAGYPNGSANSIIDQNNREAVMDAAAGVTIFRSHRAYDVQMSGSEILSVDAVSTETGVAIRISSEIFIDCTGDGWIGYWAGADYRYGRESYSEFGEQWAAQGDLWSPSTPDNRIMGASILWGSSAKTSTSTFPAVPWAMDVAKTHSALAGEWYWEYSDNDKHAIADAEDIRDHMLRAIYGSFYNAKQSSSNDYRKLDWVGYLSGKRESRRLMGDYIYKESDALSGTLFNDAVVEEIRDIDVHYQRALVGDPRDFLSVALYRAVPRYYVPFRCLYSRNIDNLMMAGRCFSCSHIGLGGPRVMNTCGQMGIATGYAASLCKKYSTSPRGIYTNYITQLKALVSNTVIPDPVPIAYAGYSYVTWLDNGTLALAGTVDDSGEGDIIDTDVVWSIKTSPPGSAATLTKTSTDWANPTANFTPD
ncbi:MAG: FAD-dependent oxidoreductase, partial [Anaerolineae bacterium]|nr:FAD-dependent oxidoreductase [Anaerolineae bacterium]